MKKLSIGKNEGIAEVVERLIADTETGFILVMPKGCSLGTSVSNFHLLKREADAAGKTVAIESVDENVLAFAKSAKIEAAHPLFEPGRAGSLSDIRPAGEKQAKPAKKPAKGAVRLEVREEKEEPLPAPKIDPTERSRVRVGEERVVEEPREERGEESGTPESALPRRDGFYVPEIKTSTSVARRTKFVFMGIAALLMFAGAAWTVNAVWGSATVMINFKKTPWTYDATAFIANTTVSRVNTEKRILPAERFTESRNLVKPFPASAFKDVSEKATAKLTIYNAYSSQAQSLLVATRFVTPDGKIFRLVNEVLVPGAKVTDGKIIPSSVETNVVADKAGVDYNVGPTARLDVPGFKGSPKYEGFYGELKEGAKGGFTGKKPVPTAEDIAAAKQKTAEILKESLTNSFLTSYPKDFKILDGASTFSMTRLDVNEKTDEGGNFSVFGEAVVTAIGFREADFKELLLLFAIQQNRDTERNQEIEFKELTLNYSGVTPNFKDGSVAFTVAAEGTLVPRFMADDFKKEVLGKGLTEVRSLVEGIGGLADGRVSFWPIWLRAAPSNPDRVNIVVN